MPENEEQKRLDEEQEKKAYWRRWGPYLSERQWGTVREDYSSKGTAWEYFPHEHARSRVYRWGEDGIGGISDYFNGDAGAGLGSSHQTGWTSVVAKLIQQFGEYCLIEPKKS